MKINLILLGTLLVSGIAYAQVGINTETPKATLDVTASPLDLTKTDGIIAPRLKGSELKTKDANYDVPQTGAIVYITEVLAVGNTSPKTVNLTATGYYYFDGSIWQKMVIPATSAATWNLQNTTTPATLNTQNIYQNGNVGLGNFSAANPIARLDVRGAVRGGTPNANEISGSSAIGANSVAFGNTNIASGPASATIGNANNVSAQNSIALGNNNTVSGVSALAVGGFNTSSSANSIALGFFNTTGGANSAAIGSINNVLQSTSAAIGNALRTNSYNEFATGSFNAEFSGGNQTTSVETDVAFAVGNGISNTSRSNAMTLLKNGTVGFGLLAALKPTERIDIGIENGATRQQGLGSIRIRAIGSAAYTGDNTMRVMVADNLGVLKSIAQSNTLTATNGNLVSTVNGLATTPTVDILTSSDNGLTSTNGKVQLGGLLTAATIVTADATNTLAIAGLQAGSTSDKIVVADTNGVLKTVTNTLTNTSIVKKNADYTVLATDFTILVNAATAGVTVTLPNVTTSTGRVLVIRKTDETENLLTFSSPIKMSETSSFTTLNLNTTIRIQSDGTDWYKID